MADRNPYIPSERVREHEEKARKVYDENRERAAEKRAEIEEKATQPGATQDEQTPAGTPSEKKGGDFPG
jgi:vacuolar-type H+-ATPase subunit H